MTNPSPSLIGTSRSPARRVVAGLQTRSLHFAAASTRRPPSGARHYRSGGLKTGHKGCGGWRAQTQEFVEMLWIRNRTGRKDRRKPGVEWRSAVATLKII